MMSALVKILQEWWATLDGNEATVMDIAITTIEKLEKYKANAEPRLTKLDALESFGVDNWQGYDEAMRSIADEDEDNE